MSLTRRATTEARRQARTNVAQQQVGQPRLELPLTAPRRFFNRLAHLLRRHGADIFLVLGERLTQVAEIGAVRIEVRPQRNHYDRWPIQLEGCSEQVVYKSDLLRLAATESEHFFQLVNYYQGVRGPNPMCNPPGYQVQALRGSIAGSSASIAAAATNSTSRVRQSASASGG